MMSKNVGPKTTLDENPCFHGENFISFCQNVPKLNEITLLLKLLSGHTEALARALFLI